MGFIVGLAEGVCDGAVVGVIVGGFVRISVDLVGRGVELFESFFFCWDEGELLWKFVGLCSKYVVCIIGIGDICGSRLMGVIVVGWIVGFLWGRIVGSIDVNSGDLGRPSADWVGGIVWLADGGIDVLDEGYLRDGRDGTEVDRYGCNVGLLEGAFVGLMEGNLLDEFVGLNVDWVDWIVGFAEGCRVGSNEGFPAGDCVGGVLDKVGSIVGVWDDLLFDDSNEGALVGNGFIVESPLCFVDGFDEGESLGRFAATDVDRVGWAVRLRFGISIGWNVGR